MGYVSGTWPLVERRVEFDAARGALTTRTPERCGVVLTGSAGVGKTTLARQVTQSLPNVRWVVGSESARAIPLGAFAPIVPPSTATDAVGYLSAARESLLDAGAVILGVDDAHLLDPLSATLLHQLAIDGDARIIATVRSGETVPDAVLSLWKDHYLERIELDAFTREQSIDLLEQMLGGPVEGLSVDLMWEASGGNALFLHHLVDGAREAGTLRRDAGIWQLRGNASITTEFATLLEGRITSLPDGVNNALNLLSLCEPIEVDMLVDLAGEDEVEEAERRGLLRITEDGRQLVARFAHPLLGEVVRRRIGRLRGRRLRGQLANAIAARGRPKSGPGRIRLADLAIDGDSDPDSRIMLDAARSALALSDVAAAERFARAAVEHGAGIDGLDLLSRSLLWQGRPDEVEATMAAVDPETLDEVGVLRWALTRLANFDFAQGDGHGGDDMLALLRARIHTPSLVLLVDAVASVRAMMAGELEAAAEQARRVLRDDAVIPAAAYWAAFAAKRSMALTGEFDEVAEIARHVDIPPSMDGLVRYSADFGELQALIYAGRLTDARTLAEGCAQFSSPGQYLAWGMVQTFVGVLEVAEGRYERAVRSLRQATAALTSDVMSAWSFPARIALCTILAQLGRCDEAKQLAASVRSDLRPHVAVFEPFQRVAEAWIAAGEGQLSEAITIARAAAAVAASSCGRAIAAEALHASARLGDPDAADMLAELSTHVDGELIEIYTRHAAAVASKDAAALEDCSREFEELGARASAADAAAQASTAFADGGERTAAVRAAGTAHRLAAECGGLVTPAMITMEDPLPLTVREREIANLVAAGLSNREIGERLSLSTRTVEGHVYRACMKVDVEDRAGLAARIRAR